MPARLGSSSHSCSRPSGIEPDALVGKERILIDNFYYRSIVQFAICRPSVL
jgi:hypothetical protein